MLRRNRAKVDQSIMFFKGYSIETGKSMMRELLKQTNDIDAVFSVNNLVALGAMIVAKQYTGKKPIVMAAFDMGRLGSINKRPLLSAD